MTEAWQLYFGLLFMVMVMFAPGGIAGLIDDARAAVARAARCAGSLPAYLVALAACRSLRGARRDPR